MADGAAKAAAERLSLVVETAGESAVGAVAVMAAAWWPSLAGVTVVVAAEAAVGAVVATAAAWWPSLAEAMVVAAAEAAAMAAAWWLS